MKTWTRALLFCALTAGVASAQPAPIEPTPLPVEPTPPPEPEPPAPPEPPPQPIAQPIAQPQPAPADHAARPIGLTMAIGAGYLLPDSLETPNITSVRFRLESGLTLEPVVVLSQLSNTTDTGDESTTTRRDLAVGALARHTMGMRGRYDFDLLGGLFVSNSTTSPDADDADTSTTTLDAVYGISVATWINTHWVVTMSATNPVASYTRQRQEQGPDAVRVETDLLVGAIWNPTVTAMVHLYY